MKAIKAIYQILNAATNVTANVYPLRVLEGAAFPAIVLTQISRISNDTKKEYSKSDISRVQISCIGYNATEAFTLADQVRQALRYELPAEITGILVQNIAFDDEQVIEADKFGSDGAVMVVQDYLVMFQNELIVSGSLLTEEGDLLLQENGGEILL